MNAAWVLRWLARIGSIVATVLILMMATDSPRGPTLLEWTGLLFFPIGVVAGMALAWSREMLGSWLAIASLAGFYLWHQAMSGTWPKGPYFLIFALPAFVFLAAACIQRVKRA